MAFITVHSPVFLGKAKSADYTLTELDDAVGVNTSGGDVKITVPTASGVVDYPRSWRVKKMSQDNNRVIVALQTPSDSMFGEHFYAMVIRAQGEGVIIYLNANGQYTYSDWSGVDKSAIYQPAVQTLQPSLASTTLTMNGDITDLGAETSVSARFRYRDVTAGTDWVETSDVTKSATGTYSDTATVTAAHVYEVQALIETDAGTIYYGSVLDTNNNYYQDTTEAAFDDLDRYWAFQETSGTDTTAVETMDSDDMTMNNGVTIGSDSINGNTIYKRIFGGSDYGEVTYKPKFQNEDFTLLIQVDMNSNSGDHTIINFGRKRLSMASDGSGIQLEVNSSIDTWAGATPMSGILNLFIVVDQGAVKTTLYSCTSATRTEQAYLWDVPNNKAQFMRVGRGASGDANHQDTEYMDDGIVRSIATWMRILGENEMKDICDVLDNNGGLIVA